MDLDAITMLKVYNEVTFVENKSKQEQLHFL